MNNNINWDIHALRALVTAVDLGGLAHAARRLHRSPSAVTRQLRVLEEQAGQPLVLRNGRSFVLTNAGEIVTTHARRVLKLNDDMSAALGVMASEGTVRVGMPQDFADLILPDLLSRFARVRPNTHVEVRSGRNYRLAEDVSEGALDLAVAFATGTHKHHTIASLPGVWVGPPQWSFDSSGGNVVPLVMFDSACLLRDAGTDALSKAGTPWRLALTTPSLTGVWCAVRVGMGITVRTPLGVPRDLPIVAPCAAIPALPPIDIVLHAQLQSDAGKLLQDILVETVKRKLPTKASLALRRS